MWVIDQASMMWGIVSGVIESVHEFVFGNIAPAAKKIEDALADMIPVAIDLVAKLLNIGNIADKVQDIIEGVREMIDGAIDAMFETLLSALGLGGDSDQEDGEYDGEIGEEVRFSADGESHRLWIDAAGSVMVASTPMTVQARLDDWYARRTDDPSADNGVGGPAEENRARAEDYISRGRTQLTEVNSGVTAVQDASEETRGGLDTALEGDQGNLATTLTELFKLYADEQANTGTEEERVAAFAGTQHGIVQDAPSWPHDKDGSSWRYTRNSDDGPSPKTNGGAIVSASRDPWTRATYEAFIMSHSGTETHATELDSGGRAKHCIAKLSGHNSYILYDAALGTGIDNVFDKDDEGTADATLVELTNSGNLTTFFAQVASGTVPGLELPAGTTARQWFAERWAESASKDHVKRLFRQRVSGNHEWIPCANIPAIIDRASNETDLDKGSKWITAQDTLRINTADVIFSPDKEVDEEITYEPTAEPAQGFHVGDTVSVPQGHVGAVYLHSRQRVRGQQTFHEDCNNALTEDLDETIDNLKGVFEDWVWQSGTWDNKVHPETLQKGGAAFPASPPNSGMLAKFDQAKRG